MPSTYVGLIGSTLSLCVLAGCRDSGSLASSSTWQGDITQSGDTTFVHTTSGSILGDLGTIPSESLEVVYAGEGVLQSTVVTTAGERLLVGEGTQIVVIDSPDEIDTLGREGDGPGEFRRIIGLRANGDTVVALDASSSRLTSIPRGGAPASVTVEAPDGFSGLRYTGMAHCQSRTLITWNPRIVGPKGMDRTPDTVAVAWWKPGPPTTPWLRAPDLAWIFTGNMFGPRNPFGTRALIASDGGCRVAIGDAVFYTVQLHDGATDSLIIISADAADVPVTADARTIPEQWRGEFDSSFLPAMLNLFGAQEFSDTRNKVQAIHMDGQARLWVQVVDSTYMFHPTVMYQVAEARPSTYRWDVFGTDGKRLAIVHLPSNFTPRAWAGRWVYGIAEDEDGALVVGRLPVPGALK